MRQIDQEIIQATDELKNDVALTTDIITGNENTVVEVAPGNTVRSPKKMIEDCYQETQEEIQQRFGSLEQAVNTATAEADRAEQSASDAAAQLPKLTAEGEKIVSTATAQADRATRAAGNAEASATESANSADAAAASATNAADSEQAASGHEAQVSAEAQKAVDAAASAEASKVASNANKQLSEQFAQTATDQASLAHQWAANPENVPVEDGQYSSLHYAIQSSEYADASSANAYQTRQDSIDAENAKREALNSASAASTSESNAADSATNAKTSETAAAASAKDANLSKVSALASENNAGSAASSALASRESAATAASTATQQANRSESEADRSEAAAEKINREGIPIGSILPYYGSSAPMGWLGLTKGATIRKADYPALFKHLTDQRKPPHHTNVAYTLTDGKWLGADSTYVVVGNSVARLENISGDRSNALTLVSIPAHISGDPFPNSGTATIYGSLIDIPLPNDECFLPDAANNFIKGYEPTGTREMGTFEQDAIRNITGDFGTNTIEGNTAAFNQASSAGAFSCVGNSLNASNIRWVGTTTGTGTNTIRLDSSRIVPTGPENVPKNLNCLWIIKAYDAVLDPEQLQAKAIIDQVNKNSSEILAVTGTANRLDSEIGYALLDFGTLNTNTVLIRPNPFVGEPVIVRSELLAGDRWISEEWIFQTHCYGFASYADANEIKVAGGYGYLFSSANNPVLPSKYFGTSTIDAMSAPCRVHVWRVKG